MCCFDHVIGYFGPDLRQDFGKGRLVFDEFRPILDILIKLEKFRTKNFGVDLCFGYFRRIKKVLYRV